jgi:ketosteroid isomerase-like protein
MLHYTPGQTFYYQLSAAIDAQDLGTLASMYHPDAVSVSMSTGQVVQGREAVLDSYRHAFQIGGAISARSVENFVETADAICVESTLTTSRSIRVQTYDVYLLQSGMVRQHVGGFINPRPPVGQGHGSGLTQTSGGAFYQRYCAAVEAGDFATYASLHHPDAVYLNCITNVSSRGREAIVGMISQATQNGGYVRRTAIESFAEAPGIVCAETTQAARRVTDVGTVQVDALMYEVFLLRAGQIVLGVGGSISPRGPELRRSIDEQVARLIKVKGERLRMIWEATHPGRWSPWPL